MLEYRTQARHTAATNERTDTAEQRAAKRRKTTSTTETRPPRTSRMALKTAKAANAQRRGLKKVAAIRRHYSLTSSSSSAENLDAGSPSESAPELSEAEQAALEEQLVEKDKEIVRAELEKYEECRRPSSVNIAQ